MRLRDILERKGWGAITISANVDVATAARIMRDKAVGSLVVLDDNGELTGLVTEHRIVQRFADQSAALAELSVRTLMLRPVPKAQLDTPIDDALRVMTEQRCRHLPVVQGNDLVGLVSIGDIVKARLEEASEEARNLREYITY